MPSDNINPKQSSGDTAVYYSGARPLAVCFLISPGLCLLLWLCFARGGGNPLIVGLTLLVFPVVLFAALRRTRSRLLWRRVLKAALAALLLSVVLFAGLYLIISVAEKMETSHLGSGFRDTLKAIGIAFNYLMLLAKLCCLLPLFSFALLLILRQYWKLSATLLLAAANLPLLAAVGVLLVVVFVGG